MLEAVALSLYRSLISRNGKFLLFKSLIINLKRLLLCLPTRPFIEYNESTKEIQGINSFGIRLRHEVLDRWLSEKRDVDYVLNHLAEANFDPEFSNRYEREILEKYESELVIRTK